MQIHAYNKNELILYCNLQNYRKESLKQVNTKLNISSNQEIYFGKCKESYVKLGPSVMMGKINLDCNGRHNLIHDMLEHFIRRSTQDPFFQE